MRSNSEHLGASTSAHTGPAITSTVVEAGNITAPPRDNGSTPPLIADPSNPFPAANLTSEKQNVLDEKFLVAIGKRIVAEKFLGPAINEPTLVRWKDVLEKRLSAKEREELAKKYLCPSNCACIEAPKINVELKNFLQALVIDRGNRLILKQNKIALCIAASSSLITLLCKNEVIDNVQMVNILSEACRLLLDLQRDESLTRRSFILMTLKQPLKDILNSTIIDEFLFSNELEEKIKAALLLEKSNKELLLIKKSFNPKNSKGPLRRLSNRSNKQKSHSGQQPKSCSTNSYHPKSQNNKREDRHPPRWSRYRHQSREKKSRVE